MLCLSHILLFLSFLHTEPATIIVKAPLCVLPAARGDQVSERLAAVTLGFMPGQRHLHRAALKREASDTAESTEQTHLSLGRCWMCDLSDRLYCSQESWRLFSDGGWGRLSKLPTMKTVQWLLFSVNNEIRVFSRERAALQCLCCSSYYSKGDIGDVKIVSPVSATQVCDNVLIYVTLQQHHLIFSMNQIVLLILIIAFNHFIITSTLLVIIYQKSHCVRILWVPIITPTVLMQYRYRSRAFLVKKNTVIWTFGKCFWEDF